jgi:hypothetical protein
MKELLRYLEARLDRFSQRFLGEPRDDQLPDQFDQLRRNSGDFVSDLGIIPTQAVRDLFNREPAHEHFAQLDQLPVRPIRRRRNCAGPRAVLFDVKWTFPPPTFSMNAREVVYGRLRLFGVRELTLEPETTTSI